MLPPLAPPFAGADQNLLLTWMEENHRRYGSIFRAQAYGSSVYVISDPAHVEHVFRRNWQNYCKGWAIKRIRLLLGRGLMVSEGELWKHQRRMIQPAFNEKAVGSLMHLFIEANETLAQRWAAAAENLTIVNATRDISLTLLEIILRAIFGTNYEDVAGPFSILSEDSSRTLQFAQGFRGLASLIKNIIAQRGAYNEDLLGMLMLARDRVTGCGMPLSQIIDEVLTLVVAGHETTASTLNWVWYLLSEHPDVAEKVHAEAAATADFRQLRYTAQVIDETMRLYPAGWLMTRRAIHDDVLDDYDVPARTEIYVSPYVIQRRPDVWPDPNRFDPDRFANFAARLTLIPFSIGPRNCIGEHFARWEMLVHVHTIAKRLRLHYLGGKPILDLGINLRAQEDFMMRPGLT